ncbi:LLM class flavin-dependent oxidoreductase [Nocardia sp. CA2R105]|uniref:LLM class flavin-dependent oxidoreductase n=1 Tax=Nocardia coffeae TaxID=2873381 RepID=UPI001CA70DF9|nr:LLM class flavin-dependent oxidoreductase [Nocardia coffeae]MBY8861146.1 LLM class flavin-dependent oxidoreductase [Nocardia coffeae]
MTAPLRLGLALDLGSDPAAGPIADQVRAAEPLLARAERAGFDSVWLGESHHTKPEAFHLPAALLVLARLVPLTGLRLGTGVLLARALDADRLATEAALLDQLSEGRLTLGLGLGPDVLRGKLGGPDRPGGPMLDALLTRLREVWRDRPDDAYVPAPHQPGGPPILVGGKGIAPARRAAALGDGYYAATNYSDRLLFDQAAAYLAASPARPRIAVNRLCIVDTDGDRARRNAEGLAKVLGYYRSRSAWNIGRADGAGEPLLIGTPAQVAARLRDYRAHGITQVQARVAPVGLSVDVARRTVSTLGEEVLPLLAGDE